MRQAKRRKDQDQEELEEWPNIIRCWSVTSETQVKREQITDGIVIGTLMHWGLSFFFKKVKGYSRPIVNEFYTNMKVNVRGILD